MDNADLLNENEALKARVAELEAKLASKKKRRRSWPDDLELTDERRAVALKHGRDPEPRWEEWRDYCASNAKVYADWDAAWRNFCRPKEWDKPSLPPQEPEPPRQEERPVVAHPSEVVAAACWGNITERVGRTINERSFDTWFTPPRALSLENGILVVAVPNETFQAWMTDHYRELLLEVAPAEVKDVRFEVGR